MEGEKREINKGQIKKIHALKNALQLSEDDYRKLLYVNFYPAASSKQLSSKQAEIFIDNLEKMAIEKGAWIKQIGKLTYEDLGYREGMASPAQLRKIEAMWKDIFAGGGAKARKKALRNWLHKYFGVSDLRFLTAARANDVIYALGKMEGRRSTGSAGEISFCRISTSRQGRGRNMILTQKAQTRLRGKGGHCWYGGGRESGNIPLYKAIYGDV